MLKHKMLETSVIKAFEKDNPEWKTRVVSGVALALCAIVVLMEVTGILHSARPKIGSDFIILALLVVQFLLPGSSIILGLVTIIAGLVNVYYGGHVLGLLFYAFGFGIFLREGFFRIDKRIKIPLMFIIFFAVVLLQFRLKVQKVIISLVNIAIATLIIWAFMYIFHDYLKEFYSTRPPLDLGVYDLTPRQIACIRGCRNKKSVKDIAREERVSETVIADELLAVYDILEVIDRHDLYRLLEGREILFESPGKLPARDAANGKRA